MKSGLLLCVAVSAVTFGVSLEADARTRARPRVKPAKILEVITPLGLQGSAGSGASVSIPFRVRDRSFRQTDIEMQYGYDRNGDGFVTDDEYRPATEARLDSRDTRANRAPQLFTTSADAGSTHGIVWRSDVDLGDSRVIEGREYLLDASGRVIRDPLDPSQPAFGYDNPGVLIRLRAVSVSGRKGPWVATANGFSVDENHRPSMTIDSANPAEDAPTVFRIGWTAYDPDSEDRNGNGALDILDGEDVNANGVLDVAPVGVAFDWHWVDVQAGENPDAMNDAQLATLVWLPCTQDPAHGDDASLVTQPGSAPVGGVASAPPGVGRSYVFAWDSDEDVGQIHGRFLLRATPFDAQRDHGETVYSRLAVQR